MRLSNLLINISPFLMGTWILRSTNDQSLKDGYTFLVLNDDNSLKLKTIYQEGIFGVKKSRSGHIENVTLNNINTSLKIKYDSYNKYSQSIFGIQIPELKSENVKYSINKELTAQLIDKSLLVTDVDLHLYYLFDLQIGKIKSPLIETGINTLIFTQFVSFFLNLILVNVIHLMIKDIYL